MGQFADAVKRWGDKTKDLMPRVVIGSTQDLTEYMLRPKAKGGNMPVLDGLLRDSAEASPTAMPLVRAAEALKRGDPLPEINLVIAKALAGDGKVFIGITAEYARRQNYGFNGVDSLGRHYSQSGSHFVGMAVQRWDAIVAENIRKADRL